MSTYKRTHQNLSLEALERRDLLSVTPALVGDFNLAYQEGRPTDNAWRNDELFFAADDGSGDVELWKSDGTAEGTLRVADIRPGAQGSLPYGFVAAGERVLFTAYTEEHGRELWATDGTEAGTVLVEDLAPGPASFYTEHSLTPMGGQVYFSYNGDLWATDGTNANTRQIVPGAAGDLTSVGDQLFLIQRNNIWKLDGTTGEKYIVKEFKRISSWTVVSDGAFLFFSAQDSKGSGFWVSDGTTEGTRVLTRQGAGIPVVAGKFVFYATSNGLWRSDGTPEGMQQMIGGCCNDWLTPVGDKVFFVGRDKQLWQSDGTREGTTRVSGTRDVSQLRESNGQLYFTQPHDDFGQELWRTDGTPEGTVPIDVALGSDSSNPWVMSGNGQTTLFWSTVGESRGLWAVPNDATQPTRINEVISGPSGDTRDFGLLQEFNGQALFGVGDQLWQHNGNDATLIASGLFQQERGLAPVPTVIGHHLYFFRSVEADGQIELWRTDGSGEGTIRVSGTDDLFFEPRDAIHANGKLYFIAEDADQNSKLWTVDEVNSRVAPVSDQAFDDPRRPVASGGKLFFEATNADEPIGTQLWMLDETQSQFVAVMDRVVAGPVDLNGELYFTRQIHEQTKSELWKFDGTDRLELLAEIPGGYVNLTVAENQLYVTRGPELWRSDGTAEGTYSLSQAYPGTRFGAFEVAGDKLFFLASTEATGEELWISDGSIEGTRLVRDIVAGAQGCNARDMVVRDEHLYFVARDETGQTGLWKSDGTEEGTVVVKENDADPYTFARIVRNARGSANEAVYFYGYESQTGWELWRTDGTEEGTIQVADLLPGAHYSYPAATERAAEINGRLYFTGDDGFHGHELWQIPLESETDSVPGDANRDGIFNSSDLVQIFQRGEYEDQIAGNSSWEDGDWDGDGEFTSEDIVLALQSGGYQAAAAIDLLSATPQLVGDFNLDAPSRGWQLDNAWLNGELFFAADDGSGDVELWKSDGTAEGTVRVMDIRPGAQGSLPSDIVAVPGRVLFRAYTEESGWELWTTDGTEAGTVRVTDIGPGVQGSNPRDIVAIPGRILFRAYTEENGWELWTTDGTEAGTVLVKDLAPGPAKSSVERLRPIGDQVYFSHNDELWVTDGTEANTQIAHIEEGNLTSVGDQLFLIDATILWQIDRTTGEKHIVGEFEQIGGGVVSNGEFLFFEARKSNREGFWVSDGTTEGTRVLTEQNVGLRAVTGEFVFYTTSGQLWRSDGTPEGTQRIFRSNSRADSLYKLMPVGDKLFFAVGRTSEGMTLWQSDGTLEGTTRVSGTQDVSQLRELNGQLYFTQPHDDFGQELWRTDGTPEGTRPIDIAPGPASSNPWIMAADEDKILLWSTVRESRGLWALPNDATQPTRINQTISGPSGDTRAFRLLQEFNGQALFQAGDQLWQHDGNDSTLIASELFLQESGLVPVLTEIGNHLYFFRSVEANGQIELWRTDGSGEGTIRVSGTDDLFFEPRDAIHANGKLYFIAEDADQNSKLWTVDEVSLRVAPVSDQVFDDPRRPVASGGNLFFEATNANEPVGTQLWMLDETQSQFVAVMDRVVDGRVDWNGETYLTRQNREQTKTELWKSDETGSLEFLAEIPVVSRYVNLTVAKNQLFIKGGGELWRSDGTAEGTYSLTHAYPGTSFGRLFKVVGDKLFFTASTEATGEELWISDGSIEGTRSVRDILPGTQGCNAGPMVVHDENLYFVASDETGQMGLWKSDGTEEGTVVVKEIAPEFAIIAPVSTNEAVYFYGYDSQTGTNLWRTDGTEEGTVQVADLTPVPASSAYLSLTVLAAEINGHLYFAGRDRFHGYELWQIPLESETEPVPGDANRDGIFDSSDLVQVLQRGEYEDQIAGNSSWEDGDWDGDGDFTSEDIVLALQSGGYQAAAVLNAMQADDTSWIDSINDQDRKKRMSLDPDSTDEIYQSLSE